MIFILLLLNNYDKTNKRWGLLSVYATSPVSIRDLFFILNAYDFGLKLMAFHKSDTQYEETREGGRETRTTARSVMEQRLES